jgi:hypothetical protein
VAVWGADEKPRWPGRVDAVRTAFSIHAAEQERSVSDLMTVLPGMSMG